MPIPGHHSPARRAFGGYSYPHDETTNFNVDFPAPASRKIATKPTRFVHPSSWLPPTSIPTFPRDKAEKSPQNQHVLSYNPTISITTHANFRGGSVAPGKFTIVERRSDRLFPPSCSKMSKPLPQHTSKKSIICKFNSQSPLIYCKAYHLAQRRAGNQSPIPFDILRRPWRSLVFSWESITNPL